MKSIFAFLLLSIFHSHCEDVNEINNKTELYYNLPEHSLYHFEGRWVNQHNDSIYLSDFRHKTVIASFIYTYCESACPIIINNFKQIERELTNEQKKYVLFLLITMDPERDTPERFRKMYKRHHLNENWMLIASNENLTKELENVLGVRAKKLASGDFDHSNIIHILNKDGVIIHQIKGLNQDISEALSKIGQELPS